MMVFKSNFFRNVLILLKGNVLFQVTIVLTLIFLARYFSPEELGEYAVYISVISIVGTIAPGRLEMAIMLPENDKEAYNIFVLSIMSILFVGGIFFLCSFLFLKFK